MALLVRLLTFLPLFVNAQHHFRRVRMTIKNVKHNEYLFASVMKNSKDRRYALTWVPGFDATHDKSGWWDVTFLPHGRVTIENVKYAEPLFVSVKKRYLKSRYVFTWVPGFDTSFDTSGQFEIRSLGSGVATLKSVKYNEYLFAGIQKLDSKRRLALTWIPGFNPTQDRTGQWLFQPIHSWQGVASSELTNQSMALFDDSVNSSNQSESVFFP